MKATNMVKLEWDFLSDEQNRQWWEAQVWEGFYKIRPRFGEEGDHCLVVRFQRDGIDNEEDRVLAIVGSLRAAKEAAQEDCRKNRRHTPMFNQ